jgi:hypothetical protein
VSPQASTPNVTFGAVALLYGTLAVYCIPVTYGGYKYDDRQLFSLLSAHVVTFLNPLSLFCSSVPAWVELKAQK